MKRYLMQSQDDHSKSNVIVDAFMKEKSLYKLRSVFRGCMGLPRMQSVDRQRRSFSPNASYNQQNLAVSKTLLDF